MTKVPLVIYDTSGNRIPIGEAEVEEVAGEWVVTGEITNERYKDFARDKNLKNYSSDYSIGFETARSNDGFEMLIPVEGALIPEPAEPLYQHPTFKGTIPKPKEDQ